MTSPWIAWPKTEGIASRQAHADMPDNTFEREMGKEGFWGPATQLHHRRAPTDWRYIEGPCRPRAFDGNKITATDSPWDAQLLFYNDAVKFRLWHCAKTMEQLVRNADGDECLFFHTGSGSLYCDFGHLYFRPGDYVVIPRGTMWRLDIDSPVSALLIEATGEHYGLPDKGLLGVHALFDPAVIDVPSINDAFKAQQDDNPWQVCVKRQNALTVMEYPYNPLDAIGWHGSLLPMRVNWRDFRPVTSHRYHLPPTVHATFMSERFMITTFCPRPIETDPGALKVPFYHNNNDYDEVIFYHDGEFFSRDNIDAGMVTFHPTGLTHGPHPKAYEVGKQAARKETNEVAVMLDTRDPLNIVEDLPKEMEWLGYVDSWKEES